MTLGEKLKKFRNDTGMTQEELAARLYVTRAAVSKWETDRGYPAIDSLRLIARLMDCTLDELVSDDDVENRKRMEMKRAKQLYFCAIVFFAVAVVFALVAYFLKNPWWTIGAFLCIVGYFACAFFSKPRYKRLAANGIYRAAVFVIMLIIVAVITVFGVVG